MNELILKAQNVKKASLELAIKTTEQKNEAIIQISKQILKDTEYILIENDKDLQVGIENGIGESLLDRLRLTESRLKDMADALIQLTELKDPIGELVDCWERPNGLKINQVRVPLGAVGMIYEARPNVTVDASSLCLKTGNAVLLRGSSSAIHSNKALVKVIHDALEKTDIPVNAVQLLEDTSRDTASKMFKLNQYLDVLIPRGSAKLIQTVIENATVPVLETGAGNCHVYIDQSADKNMAVDIAVNAKTQRPSVCNACETILVHESWAKKHLQELIDALTVKSVKIHADLNACQIDNTLTLASEDAWSTEYLDLEVALKIVKNMDEAIEHINTYGTKHSEAIISQNEENVNQFFKLIDAAALYHNASTRFTDGFEFGFGAEIGISTQKLHARGPMGLFSLTSTKYLIKGSGQIK